MRPAKTGSNDPVIRFFNRGSVTRGEWGFGVNEFRRDISQLLGEIPGSWIRKRRDVLGPNGSSNQAEAGSAGGLVDTSKGDSTVFVGIHFDGMLGCLFAVNRLKAVKLMQVLRANKNQDASQLRHPDQLS